MDDRTKASLVWGIAAGLAFLVLGLGSRIVSGLDVGLLRMVPMAIVVFAVTTGLGWYVEGRLARKRQV